MSGGQKASASPTGRTNTPLSQHFSNTSKPRAPARAGARRELDRADQAEVAAVDDVAAAP